jgi:CRP-like cAMP-binding protein
VERNPLTRKLERYAKLSDVEKQWLDDAAARDVRDFGRREDIISEGDRPDDVHLLLQGWAGRYKTLEDGRRPIMAYLIPGDLCDVQVALLDEMDHSIGTLTPCKVAYIPRAAIDEMMQKSVRLSRALWWCTLVDEAVLREWLVTIGHRPGDKRLGHLFCEMLLRSQAVGLSDDDSFELPLTQEELGDTMGMSTVHLNRMLQELRSRKLVKTNGRRVEIHDLDRLMNFSGFNPNYLHQVKRQNVDAAPS